jgi:hypothetical protein
MCVKVVTEASREARIHGRDSSSRETGVLSGCPEAAAMARELAALDAMWARLDVVVLTPPAGGSPASYELETKHGAFAYDQADPTAT